MPKAPLSDVPTESFRGPPSDPQPPKVPGCRILEKLGQGGMGEVYLAEQLEPVRRKVALKVIKLGMNSREVIARFKSERQALAVMDHPGIARIYDAGMTDDGRPYFVMEHVKGVPLEDHCDKHRLSINERLELFIRVCEAVEHAHQKAIIHRDLKPSNVLVAIEADDAHPKIIDFGVAKATGSQLTDDPSHTMLGQLIGTPEYMSPEQAERSGQDIDTRTDIYSLGVILYELLVGTKPFRSSDLRKMGLDEVRRCIREDEPPRLSTRVTSTAKPSAEMVASRRTDLKSLNRDLRGDLDWITMKAMEKDRTRRYPTATDLALDIRRHLANRPVWASPPGAAYRAGKFVKRYRAGIITLTAAVLALAVGLVLAVTGFLSASSERDKKQAALNETEAVTTFLADMLEAVEPGNAGRDVTVREMLDEASRGIGTSFEPAPLIEARLRGTIGSAYQALGLLERADEHLPMALEIRRRELGPNHPDTLESKADLAMLLQDQGRYDEAETLLLEAIDLTQETLGPEHPATLRARSGLANAYFRQGRTEEAASLHLGILDARTRILGEKHPDTLLSVVNLATTYWDQGKYAEAEPLYRNALALRRETSGSDHPATLDVINNLAALYHVQKRWSKAEALYSEALEVSRRVRGDEHPETLVSKGNLAELYADRGENERAERLLDTTIAAKERALGADHPSTLYSRAIRARLYARTGRTPTALDEFRALLATRQRLLGKSHPQTMGTYRALAELYESNGETRLALRLAEESEGAEPATPPAPSF